ncbi:MAG: toprim domain-containing protein [Chloroflexi bacterium]|nr:toprim domain-containing protein [Chloroflexota bacterium]
MIGRSLDDGSDRPKYLALGGERPVLGFERAVGRKEAVLCEGVFDYLTAVSWGLPAFSPCGTHIPAERLGFLARAERVFGVFDGDDAGDEAAARFGVQLGDRWRPLRLPDGTDLNELGLRPHGRDWFYRLLSAARSGVARTEVPRGHAQ